MTQSFDPTAHTWQSIGDGRVPLRRILVVHTQRLGDVICAMPMLGALRRQFPRAHVTALVQSPTHTLLSGHPSVDSIIAFDRQREHRSLANRLLLIRQLQKQNYDWVLSIHARGTISFALAQCGIPWRTVVWRYGDRKKPHWARMYHQHIHQDRLVGNRHEIEHNLDILRKLGIDPQPEERRVYLSELERARARDWLHEHGWRGDRPLAILHPGHGGGRQVWPPAHYARVAEGLVERGYQVATTGSGIERPVCDFVRSAARVPVLQFAGEMGLRQLAATIAEASLFVSVPTGPMHLASALQVPVVALYGPRDLAIDLTRFSPYQSPYRTVVSHTSCPCAGSRCCPDPVCLREIGPDSVLRAAAELEGASVGRPVR